MSRTIEMKASTPCPVCFGRCVLYFGPRDPIEGSKMQRNESCVFCNGKGSIWEDDIRYRGVTLYHQAVALDTKAHEKAVREAYAKKQATIEKIKTKLTPEERKLIDWDKL